MDTPFRFNFGGEEDEKAPNAAGPTERLAGTAEIDTVNTTPGTAGMETDLPSELQPDQVHRLLLIFIRADAGRTGLLELADAERLATLTRGTRVGDALATRSDRARADAWGFNAWSSAATDQGSNKGSSMTPDEWLETAANALRSSSAPDTEFAQFVSLAEAKLTPLPLISSSPPVSRQMRETSGKNYSHTLAVAAAVGNVGAMRYLMTNGFCDKEPKSASLDPSGQSVATFLSKLDVPVEHRGRETRSESESDSDSDSSEAEARFAATRERKARLSEAAEVLGMIEPRNKSTLSPKDPIWTRREWRPLPRSRKLAVDKATSRQMSGISAYERFNNGELTITNLCQALDALGPERRVKAIREISRVYNATLAPVTGRAYCRLTQRVLPIIRCQRCRVTAYCGLKQRDADAKQHARWCESLRIASSRTLDETARGAPVSAYPKSLPSGWIHQGWSAWFNSNAPSYDQLVETEPLSFPLTVAYHIAHVLGDAKSSSDDSHVPAPADICLHVVGAGGKEASTDWQILSHLVPKWVRSVHVILIGPEMPESIAQPARSGTSESTTTAGAATITVEVRQGQYQEVAGRPGAPVKAGLRRAHLILALNSGIHTYASWSPALVCILRSPLRVPFVVTAWNPVEAVVVRQMLLDLDAVILSDLVENPFSSLLPKPLVEDIGTCAYDNRYAIVVRKPTKR